MTMQQPDSARIDRVEQTIAHWRRNGLSALETTSQALPMITKSVTAAYTWQTTDKIVLADATGGAFTVALPMATGRIGQQPLIVKRLNAGGNAVTIGSAGGTIDGAATASLAAQYATKTFVSDGTNWHVIGSV